MERESLDESTVYDHNNFSREDKNDSVFLSSPKNVGLAASGAFLLCCVLLCPCFYKKRKETAETVLAKELNLSKSYLLLYVFPYLIDYKLTSRCCLSDYNDFVLVCKWSEKCPIFL